MERDWTIKLLHPWVRFRVESDADCILLQSPPVPPTPPVIDKTIVKRFVGLSKDTQKNKIYARSATYRILAGGPIYLCINDKKGRTTKKGPLSYHYIDSIGQFVNENDIWFDWRMATLMNSTATSSLNAVYLIFPIIHSFSYNPRLRDIGPLMLTVCSRKGIGSDPLVKLPQIFCTCWPLPLVFHRPGLPLKCRIRRWAQSIYHFHVPL